MNNNNKVTILSSILCTSDISPECKDLNGLECYVIRKIAILLANNTSNLYFYSYSSGKIEGLFVTEQGTINNSHGGENGERFLC
jgi:hypothetical protein